MLSPFQRSTPPKNPVISEAEYTLDRHIRYLDAYRPRRCVRGDLAGVLRYSPRVVLVVAFLTGILLGGLLGAIAALWSHL